MSASAVRFLAGAQPDAALCADLRALTAWDAAAFFDVTLAFLSGDEATRVEAALDGVIETYALKAVAAKRLVRVLTIAVGGAIKNGLNGAQLAVDLSLLGERAGAT